MGVKNRKNQQATTTKLVQHNYYGFNDLCWKSVYAENATEAEQLIRRALKLTNKQSLTVKPM